MSITPPKATVYENKDITLTCQATGKPAPTLSWYMENDWSTALQDGSTNYTLIFWSEEIADNQTVVYSNLTILSADHNDVGNYSCAAKNKLTELRIYRQVDVYCKSPIKVNKKTESQFHLIELNFEKMLLAYLQF